MYQNIYKPMKYFEWYISKIELTKYTPFELMKMIWYILEKLARSLNLKILFITLKLK